MCGFTASTVLSKRLAGLAVDNHQVINQEPFIAYKMLPTGLTYTDNVLTHEDQEKLISFVQFNEWDSTLSRKTQHYGYRYEYGSPSLTKCGDIPPFMTELLKERTGYLNPEQVIINHYEPGQGIAAHTDHVGLFGDTVVIFSLLSPITMTFTHPTEDPIDLRLLPGSCLVMKGDARYKWKHEIKARKSDKIDGHAVKRSTRISVTFRWRRK